MTSRSSFDASSVPVRREGDADSDHVGSADRFVLDCVDGISSVEELAMMLAMNEPAVIEALVRLTELQLIAPNQSESSVSEGDSTRELQPTADFAVEHLLAQLQEVQPSGADADFHEDDEGAATTMRFSSPAEMMEPSPSPPPMPNRVPEHHKRTRVNPQVRPTVPLSLPKSGAPTVLRPSSAPPAAAASAAVPSVRGRTHADTPRKELDSSWFTGLGALNEPDEGLTAREASQSGIRAMVPSQDSRELRMMARSRGHDATDRVDIDVDATHFTEPMIRPSEGFELDGAQVSHGSGSYPRQTFERPPGGFLGGAPPSEVEERDTSEVPVIRNEDLTTEVRPVAPSSLPEESVKEEAPMPILDAESLPPRTVKAASSTSSVREAGAISHLSGAAWAEEPIAASLRADQGGWSIEEARYMSYYLRLIQSGTYYDIFGVSADADGRAITMAANALRRHLRLDALKLRASDAGLDAMANVKRGMERALDVLQRPDARTQYDAALQALAAFKL